MTSAAPVVHRATAGTVGPAVTTLAAAFADDPIMTWMVGADRDVAARLAHFFDHLLHAELRRPDHLVDTVGTPAAATAGSATDVRAVAVWHDIDRWKTSVVDTVKMAPAAVRTFGRRLPQALQTVTMMEKVHPRDPHRHLAFIGVHPSHQGRGLGGALLVAMTQDCDEQGIAAYLESSNPRNEALYARYGFVATDRIALPSGAPPMTAMWRDPR